MLTDGPADAWATFVFAHGAGAPMDTPFMETIATGLAEAGMRVVRFEFPYMARRRKDGKRRGPERMPALLDAWSETLHAIDAPAERLLIGGKSMGGRAAATFAADPANVGRIRGVVCLGYPFHPAGRPGRTRLEPLAGACTPVLVVQGERDRLGNRADVSGYDLPPDVEVAWLADGDHSFVPRKASGTTAGANLEAAVAHVVRFARSLV